MQSGPALPGKDQVYHMSWSKMVLILVIFPLQKSGKLVPKEVRCMARCLGHAADAILCREVFMSQSTMFWWRWIILGLLTKLFLNSQKKPFSSLCGPAKEMCLQFSGRNMGFRVRDLHSHHSLKVLSHQWVASQDFKLDCLKLVPSILSLKKKKIYIYIYIHTHTHTHPYCLSSVLSSFLFQNFCEAYFGSSQSTHLVFFNIFGCAGSSLWCTGFSSYGTWA